MKTTIYAIIGIGLLLQSSQLGAGVSKQLTSKRVPALAGDFLADMSLQSIEQEFQSNLRKKNKPQAKKLAKQVYDLSKAYSISPSLILSVIKAESSFQFHAQSHKNAFGLMQIQPGTAEFISKKYNLKGYKTKKDLLNPSINLSLGVAYIHYLRNRFSNSVKYVAAYNMGPNAVAQQMTNGTFRLGKLEKYVSEIHDSVETLRFKSAKNSAIASF